jgi:DNA-binding Lrp family transcriptional regulator
MTTTHQKNMEEPSKYIIFHSVLLDELNHRQAILIGLLNGMAKKQGYAYLKNSTICQLLKASESSIKSDLKRLEELKLIRRELIRNDKNEVIQRRIYPMFKFCTEVGVDFTLRVGQDLTIPGGKISPRDSNNNITIIDKEYQETLNTWLNYKKSMKNEYKSQQSLNTLIKTILEKSTPQQFAQVVDLSIMNGWKGLFFNKIENNTSEAPKLKRATLDD